MSALYGTDSADGFHQVDRNLGHTGSQKPNISANSNDSSVDYDPITNLPRKQYARPAMRPHEGSISQSLQDIFARVDRDRSGFIDFGEIRQALALYGFDASDDDCAKTLRAYDEDPDGKLDLNEFANLIADLEQVRPCNRHDAIARPPGCRVCALVSLAAPCRPTRVTVRHRVWLTERWDRSGAWSASGQAQIRWRGRAADCVASSRLSPRRRRVRGHRAGWAARQGHGADGCQRWRQCVRASAPVARMASTCPSMPSGLSLPPRLPSPSPFPVSLPPLPTASPSLSSSPFAVAPPLTRCTTEPCADSRAWPVMTIRVTSRHVLTSWEPAPQPQDTATRTKIIVGQPQGRAEGGGHCAAGGGASGAPPPVADDEPTAADCGSASRREGDSEPAAASRRVSPSQPQPPAA